MSLDYASVSHLSKDQLISKLIRKNKKLNELLDFNMSIVSRQAEEISDLKQSKEKLREQIRFQNENYHDIKATLTKHQYSKLQDRLTSLKIRREPFECPKEDFIENKNYILLTITLPPKRFPVDLDLKEYLLYKIAKFYKYCNHLYGCIEFHKNGRPHAHILLDYQYSKLDDLKKYCFNSFRDTRYNNRAIRFDYIDSIQKTMNYINKIDTPKKRGSEFFKLKKSKVLEYLSRSV